MGAITNHIGLSYNVVGAANSIDPYYRLVSEIYDYLVSLTGAGGDFEGFTVYKKMPKNKSLFFPCLIIDSERGLGRHIFGGDYKEGGAITVKVMFTHRDYYELDVM